MKRIFLAILLLLFLAACSGQNTQVVEDIIIKMSVDPEPPVAGDAILLITLTETDGTAIDGALVAVHGDMDHEGMIPIDSESSESDNGLYRVPFEWTMGGGWILNVTATLPDNRGMATQQFEIFVGAISQDSVINRSPSEGISIRYTPDNDPAIGGDAIVTIIVLGETGLPLEDATISLYATMPEHDMLPVTAEAESSSNGRYLIPLRWTMAGEWIVEVTVTLDDGTIVSQTFEQAVVMGE
jgi:hypothetical protein